MADLSIQQQKQLDLYLRKHPNVSRKQAIQQLFTHSGGGVNPSNKGISVEKSKSKTQTINLPSGRKIVIKDGIKKYYAANGVQLNPKYFIQKEGKIDIKPSGRYSVNKGGKTRYYAANGVELKENYFKQVETPDIVVIKNGKNISLNKTIQNRLNRLTTNLKKAEDENGFIGKGWSGFKNLTGIGDSSDKVRELQKAEQKLLSQFNANSKNKEKIFLQLTGQKYSQENLLKFLNGEIKLKSELALTGYKEGQKMAVDVTADVVSGVVSFGVYTAAVAAAPFTGGASIALGVAAAAGTGALVKTGLKYADAKSGGRKYTLKDAGHDVATGAFSGALAPVTAGAGGAVGKVVTVQAGKAGLKAGAAKAVAFTAEVSTDGAIGGGVDNAFRTAVDGGSAEEILDAGITGAKYGAVLGPVMGWGGKALGKTYKVTKGALKKADDVVPTPIVKRTHTELKEEIASGQKVNVTQDANIKVPKGRLRAPSSKFAETDEAFRNIVRNHTQEFYELSKKSGDEFIREAFRLCKKYMGLEDAPIGLEIGNWSASEADAAAAVIRIGRNWKNGDKAELLGAVAHELDHMFQYKEMYINSMLDDINYNIKPEFKRWIENQDEFLNNHNQFYYDKGHVYSENFANYIEPNENYALYIKQPVEAEAHRRGDLVRDEFKNLISSSTSRPSNVRLGKYEQAAAQKIANYFSNNYPNITQEEMTEIINDAVTTMKQPEFANMHYEEFVEYFISLY